MVQGITGAAARTYTKAMLEYGTKVVGGVSPGKGGENVHGVPVYNTVRECQEQHPEVRATVLWVPAKHARDAVLEAISAGIRLMVLTTQGVPVHDIIYMKRKAREKDLLILGGNTLGVISPGKSLVGMLPKVAYKPGHIGIVSRSGLVTYYISSTLELTGMGVSTNAILGGDDFTGAGYEDILRRFEDDLETEAVVVVGQPGGALEETAIGFMKNMQKPVVAYITGVSCPEGIQVDPGYPPVLPHKPTGANKAKVLRENGIPVADTLLDISRLLKRPLRK
jgi:succinyl-CoA synthetase alpha subunit